MRAITVIKSRHSAARERLPRRARQSPGDRDHTVDCANPTERDRFEAARLEREAEVHRLDRITHRPRTRKIDHVAASESVEAVEMRLKPF